MPKLNFKLLTDCILGGGYKLTRTTEIKKQKTTKISLVKLNCFLCSFLYVKREVDKNEVY